MGDVCLKVPSAALGRGGFDDDPVGSEQRLRWYFARLVKWVECASNGTLVIPGEAFELPQFTPGEGIVAHSESEADLSVWLDVDEPLGIVEFAPLRADPLLLLPWRYSRFAGQTVREITWGKHIKAKRKDSVKGLWLKLDRIPVLPPYQAPMTWGELRQIFRSVGRELDNLLPEGLRHIRDGRRHFGVLGFPIPETWGGQNVQMHWQAFSLPTLSFGEKCQNGFRKSEKSYWMRDRAASFRDADKIKWLRSENWAEHALGTRGQLPIAVRTRSVCIIGAGAIGSILAEQLVRGGVTRIVVVDPDKYMARNFVRHTLLLNDVTTWKAPALTERLNRISPHVCATPIIAAFPSLKMTDRETVEASELIVDCTGSDDAATALSMISFKNHRWFWSVSLSLGAVRSYVFSAGGNSFPANRFHAMITPWIARDRQENEHTPLPREGVGCWHPVFPARGDEATMMASAALSRLSDSLVKGIAEPTLSVFERLAEGGIFSGVSLVPPDANTR